MPVNSLFPIDHISYSMFELWNSCRECFKYKYILKLKGEEIPALKEGQQYHFEVDRYHKGLSHNAELIKDYTRVFLPGFRKESEVWIGGDKNPPLFLVAHGEALELPITGKIDGINDEGLHDLKYMSGSLSQKQVDELKQPTFYVWAYFNLTNKILPFYYEIVDKKTGRVSMLKTIRGIEHFDLLFEDLKNFINEIKTGDFSPLPGSGCRFSCEYSKLCANCAEGYHGH